VGVMFCEWPKVPQRDGPLSCILFAPPVLANTLLKVNDVFHVNQLKGYYASSQLAFCIEWQKNESWTTFILLVASKIFSVI
jgi:hypothetical protein